jgi:hypothetical protein
LTIELQCGYLIWSNVTRKICDGSISAWHLGQNKLNLVRIASRSTLLRAGIPAIPQFHRDVEQMRQSLGGELLDAMALFGGHKQEQRRE